MTYDRSVCEAIALRVREHILSLSTDGGCFTGASLSCTDLLVYLYTSYLNVGSETLTDPNRDILLLSKGHDVPALYGTFAELGFIERARLANHLDCNDHVYWHPNREVPGVEFHSGSLGHLLSVGMGMALSIRMEQRTSRVVVILGDGELNEGSIWEAMQVAHALRLDNLIAIVDRNWFQANVRTEELIPLEPLEEKFQAFGWNTARVDGHDYDALHECMNTLPQNTGRPTVVIADTLRGKGVPSIQERADRWFCNFTHDEVAQLKEELYGTAVATLVSPTLIVR